MSRADPLISAKATVEDVQADAKKLTEEFHSPDALDERTGFRREEPKKFDDLYKQITTLTPNSTSLTEAIRDLEIKLDDRLNITRYKKEGAISTLGHDRDHKDTALVRDARRQDHGQIFQKPEDTPEAGIMSILGTTRGAFEMIEKSEGKTATQKATLKNEILAITQASCADMYKDGKVIDPSAVIDKIKNAQTHIVLKLHESKISIGGEEFEKPKDLAKALGDFRDACNMKQDEPNHLVTVIKGLDDDTVTTISAKVTPLSEKQRQDLRDIQNAEIPAERKPQWFQDLKPYQKEIVKDNADRILEGNITIPTTLRFMPGIRNFLYTNDLQTKDGETILLNDNLRTATPAYYAGKERTDLEVTKENLKHVESVAGGEIEYQIYNNALQPGDEAKIVSLAKKGTEELGIEFSSVAQQWRPNKVKMVKDIAEGGAAHDPKSRPRMRAIACKSGKDRTAGAQEVISNSAYKARLKRVDKKITKEQQAQYSEFRSRSAHNATIAHRNNIGSAGLKTKGSYASGGVWKAVAKIFTAYSKLRGEKDNRSLLGSKAIDENDLAKLNAIALDKKLVKQYKKKTSVASQPVPTAKKDDTITYVENPIFKRSNSSVLGHDIVSIMKGHKPSDVTSLSTRSARVARLKGRESNSR